MFILNSSIEKTKFQDNGGPISRRNLTFMTVDNVTSFTQALTYTSSDIQVIRKIICTPIHVFKKIFLA